MSLYACNENGIAAVGTIHVNMADADVADGGRMKSLGSSHSVAQTDIDWGVTDILHREVTDLHIFHLSTIDGFQCQSPAMCEGTMTDVDMTETAVTP